jgi:hypothetical protein
VFERAMRTLRESDAAPTSVAEHEASLDSIVNAHPRRTTLSRIAVSQICTPARGIAERSEELAKS